MNPKQTIKVFNVMFSNGDINEELTFLERHFVTKNDAISYCFFKRNSVFEMLNECAENYAPFLTVNADLSMKLMEKHTFEALYDIDDESIKYYKYHYNEKFSLDKAYENLMTYFETLLNLGYYVEEGVIKIY